MVATLVPATAFAAAPNGPDLDASLAEAVVDNDFADKDIEGSLDKAYTTLIGSGDTGGYHDSLLVTPVKSGLKLSGVLPYVELKEYSASAKTQQAGHYVAYTLNVTGADAYLRKAGVHGLKDGTELSTTDLGELEDEKTTMIHRLDSGTSITVDWSDAVTGTTW